MNVCTYRHEITDRNPRFPQPYGVSENSAVQEGVATELSNCLNRNRLPKMQRNTQSHTGNFRDVRTLHSECFASLDMIFTLIEFIIEPLLLVVKGGDRFFSWYDNLRGNRSLFFG